MLGIRRMLLHDHPVVGRDDRHAAFGARDPAFGGRTTRDDCDRPETEGNDHDGDDPQPDHSQRRHTLRHWTKLLM